MSTVQILYKQYKSLPETIQNQLKDLILNESIKKDSLRNQIIDGLIDVKKIRKGESKALTLSDIFDE